MTWTILVLVVGVLLYLFGGMLLPKGDEKKPSAGKVVAKKCISVIAIILIAGSMCRLYMPYYLTAINPAIVQEMVNGMQEQQQAEKNKQIRKFVRSEGDKMMRDAPILGNRDAKKTIYVWTDFSCPYCRRVHGEIERVLADRDDTRVVIKNFSIHGPLSDGPARAVIAANMQDPAKAAELTNMLMTREFYTQDDLKDQDKIAEKVEANVMKMAAEAGLDTEQLKKDMDSDVVARELRNVRDLAQRFEISGTPFLIIGEQAFPGAIPAAQIETALDEAE
ncbi:MAG TPA: thioredoxin domain-containing protein [Candidatus Enterousia intestinigallinarum]|uniref:Thioredoxin domain-containing protein n=1 Tax=Candidatus Enterousia intestinigallinarum TaxID=2840790 RepID=A0A9D1FGG6_9PROT|nr:thioredoxin domain-containing protein [Candidatus Enterousia intestinigallinarum]